MTTTRPNNNITTGAYGLSLGSVSLLKKRYFPAINWPTGSYWMTRRMGEASVEDEQWLREEAQNGNCFAMERLGERLIDGAMLGLSPDEGVYWLRQAIELGSVSAMYALSVRMLDDTHRKSLADEGHHLLLQAAEKEYLMAISELGIRLLTGEGMMVDRVEGEYWLRKAAGLYDRVAMILLGRWLIIGRYLNPSQVEGHEWLTRAGAVKAADTAKLGNQLYLRALAAPTNHFRRRLTEEAASLLLDEHINGNHTAAVDLAYMVRRNEVNAGEYPSLDELLKGALQAYNHFAMVNQALRLAAGIQCEVDWISADQAISQMSGSQGVLEWWLMLCQAGEPEGHLVVGWLVRHGLTVDPDELELHDRFSLIRDSRWIVPDWMNYHYTGTLDTP